MKSQFRRTEEGEHDKKLHNLMLIKSRVEISKFIRRDKALKWNSSYKRVRLPESFLMKARKRGERGFSTNGELGVYWKVQWDHLT